MVIAQEDGTCRDSKREYQEYLPANPLSITIVIAGNPHLVTIEFPLGPSPQDVIDEAKKICMNAQFAENSNQLVGGCCVQNFTIFL